MYSGRGDGGLISIDVERPVENKVWKLGKTNHMRKVHL